MPRRLLRTALPGRYAYGVTALVLSILIHELLFEGSGRGYDTRVYYWATNSILWNEVNGMDRLPVKQNAQPGSAWNGNALYGDASGLDWPMWYRYPPIFLFFFVPFAAMRFNHALLLITILKGLSIQGLCQALASKLRERGDTLNWIPFAAISLILLYIELRTGNIQMLIFALVAAALLSVHRRPIYSGILLGTATALKVWPLAFLPYLAALRMWRIATLGLVIAAILTVAPVAYFGWHDYSSIMSAWWDQEYSIAKAGGAIAGPSQSLKGVLERHLSDVDTERFPDSNYPSVNSIDLSTEEVNRIWLMLTCINGLGMLFLTQRTRRERLLELHGVAFCAVTAFQPYTTKSQLVQLLWPALIAFSDSAEDSPTARRIRWIAVLIPAFILVNPGREAIRAGEALGMYLLPTLSLGISLTISILNHGDEYQKCETPSAKVGKRRSSQRG